MREETNPEKELNDIKYQLAQLSYDIFNLRISGTTGSLDNLKFDELSSVYKAAWTEAVWAAVEAGKLKNMTLTDSLSKKELDDGYIVYNGCKELKKQHKDLFTYSKFPLEIKQQYRQLAKKVYEKIDLNGGEINEGIPEGVKFHGNEKA